MPQNITIAPETLIRILNNLLSMRVKAFDAPCSSDQHFCTAIGLIAGMIPEYKPDDPEHLYELMQALLNQEALYGRLSADKALKQLKQFEPKENDRPHE
jgi:hypothetical protein